MKYMLESSHLHGLTETEMAYLGGTLFGAGSDVVRCLVSVLEDMFLRQGVRLPYARY